MKNFKIIILVIVLSFTYSYCFSQETESLVSLIQNNKESIQFYSGLQSTDLIKILQEDGPYTVFAPTNSGFEKLDSATYAELIDPKNKKRYTSVLKLHIVKGNYNLIDLTDEINKMTDN